MSVGVTREESVLGLVEKINVLLQVSIVSELRGKLVEFAHFLLFFLESELFKPPSPHFKLLHAPAVSAEEFLSLRVVGEAAIKVRL